MTRPATLAWFARHEARLAWRDALTMLRGGRKGRGAWVGVGVLGFVALMHGVAYGVLGRAVPTLQHPDKAFFVALTGSAFLSWTLLLSQAMETATRFFYARADLDLVLSSPASAPKLFAVRIGAIALTTIAMAMLLLGPVIDVMALLGGARFLLAYGVLVALGSLAVAIALGVTALLFRVVGPKRTRLLTQIIAAVVGAGFAVGIQAAAILSDGSLSRLALFRSPAWIAAAPDLSSPLWWPARAAMGDAGALALVLGLGLGLLAAVTAWVAPAFVRDAASVASVSDRPARRRRRAAAGFHARSQAQALRRKEWVLLARDPWLVSQSLMQVLYLLPPALLLWYDFGTGSDAPVVLVPVIVMAAGQLAGGLAWLAISGEDAPDLVATAPIPKSAILRAKIEAVLIAVALPVVPLALAMVAASPVAAGITLVGGGLAAAGASAIQLIFKRPARRTQFRRRQTASRLATFAEAFVSIFIAAAAGLAAMGTALALVPFAVAGAIILGARAVAPREA